MQPTTSEILEIHERLANGDSVPNDEAGRVLAVVRWMNGLGPDPTSPRGKVAYAEVVVAMEGGD